MVTLQNTFSRIKLHQRLFGEIHSSRTAHYADLISERTLDKNGRMEYL